jgi:tRNA threonylcarbamoyladenosine biosynthesis protein TsaE
VLARSHPNLVGGPPLVHVDAYRLTSAVELDDLDIDFARSVVVMEWGAGLVEGLADSWLDIRIERPAGAPVATDAAAGNNYEESEEGDELVEPRTVLIAAVGDRWAGFEQALGAGTPG